MEVRGQSHAPIVVTLPKINRRILERVFHNLIAIRTELFQNKRMNSLRQHSIELFKYYEPDKGVDVDGCDLFQDCHNSVSKRD
jgi:hypothetical protein